MSKQILFSRIQLVRAGLHKRRISCLIVTKPANVTYITGFLGDESWAVITTRAVYLVTDSRYIEQARRECHFCRIIERTGHMTEAVGKLISRVKSTKTAAVENSISVSDYRELRKNARIRLRSAANIIEPLRSIKDRSEIAAVRAAANIAANAFEQTLNHIRPAITENELAGVLDLQIRKLGAASSFDTIVAFGPNASRPHHQPGTKKLKKNDTILIDFGARYRGYCCDITRCFALGRVSRFYRTAHKAVQQAQTAAIRKLRDGADIRDVDEAARWVIRQYNLPVYGHGTGHGLGLQVHELPVVSSKAKGKFVRGQIFTIEPAVYIPNKLGIRIEDDILVTENGSEILTRNCPHLDSYKL